MERVRFGDVVKEVKVNIDRSHNPYEFYVAGDHMDSEDLTIRRKGRFATDDVGPAFIRLFKPGQVLYGSRRTYLKKVAVADFEGITANTTFVLETKDENVFLQKLLLFLMLSDSFTEWSVKKSKGSTNPYVLFSDLADYEFNLPSLEEQRKLADLLWSAYDLKESYKRLLAASDEMANSRFVEMFGDPIDNPKGWLQKTISQVTKDIISGVCMTGESRPLLPGEKAVLKVSAVTYGFFKDDEYKVLPADYQPSKAISPQKGDLLFSRANTKEMVGATALVTKDYPNLFLPDKLWKIVFKDCINITYAKHFLSTQALRRCLSSLATGTSGSMYNISMKKLYSVPIMVPSLKLQDEFAAFIEQLDKSKVTLQKSITALDDTIKTILNKNLAE